MVERGFGPSQKVKSPLSHPAAARDRGGIGLVVPPVPAAVPAEAKLLYPEVDFCAAGVGLASMTPEGYEAAIGLVIPRALELANQGAEVISLMGTSLSFFRGAAFNTALRRALVATCGCPATTMSSAIVRGLGCLGIARVVAVTAYAEAVNSLLRSFLVESGFDVAAVAGLGLTSMDGPERTASSAVCQLVADTYRGAGSRVDGVLISCGGLRTLDIVPELEAELGLPIVSSDIAGLWDAVGLLGKQRPLQGHGRLLSATWQELTSMAAHGT